MRYTKLLVGILYSLTLSACILPDQGEESETIVDIVEPDEIPDPSTYVCDPFSDEQGQTRNQGIKGNLYYLTNDQPEYSSVNDYLNFGHFVEGVDLFFNQLHIPTRPFDRGFTTMSGHTVTTVNGDTLYEWFALHFQGRISKGESQPGAYQFAILSDDGAIMKIDRGNGLEEFINNDGNHPTRMACASEPLYLGNGDKLPFTLDFHQGPRYHIALMLLWRPWPEDNKWKDTMCGKEGNDLFFDSTKNPPAPQAAYQGLLARGWEPVPTINYYLPEANEASPCNEPAPVISNFRIVSVTSDSVTVGWTTDRPATSLAYYRRLSESSYIPGPESTVYETVHFVTITGLTPNTDYGLRAVSRSTSGLGTESGEITVRTRR